jgi:sugar/nucleoside kinase (ribokinase family)
VSDLALYTVGNFTIDDIVFWPGGQTWMSQPGGNVLFSALGARIWLERVGLLARIGNDYPRERLQAIEARGICLGLHEVDVPTLHDWALYEAKGVRQFINHINSGTNEDATIGADELPPEHLGGQAYHVAPVPTYQQAALVRKLKRPGRLISLDPHETWIIGHEAAIYELLGEVDLFLPSEVEARHLYGRNAPEQAAREFARHGPRAVVVKIGTEGSILYDAAGDRVTHVPIYPSRTTDPTGAGDAYCGGFLAGYLLTHDALTAALYATVSASYVVEAIGALATPQPSAEEALARVQAIRERIE